MKLIVDNNIFFSLMNSMSVNSYLFSSLRAKFFSPEYVKVELEKHKEECLDKSGLSGHELEIRQNEVEESIKFFKTSEYERFLEKAKDSLSDPDDADFLALGLSIKAAIWSNDPHLKQQLLVKVYTTEQLVDKLLKEEPLFYSFLIPIF